MSNTFSPPSAEIIGAVNAASLSHHHLYFQVIAFILSKPKY